MDSKQRAIYAGIPAPDRCDICHGEQLVSYIQSAGGFSEPERCYKCNGTGRKPVHPDQQEANK